jgi:hypothetical protein
VRRNYSLTLLTPSPELRPDEGEPYFTLGMDPSPVKERGSRGEVIPPLKNAPIFR